MTQKPRILQVLATLRTGGAENLVTNFVPILRADGYDVEVAVFSDEITDFRKELEKQGVKIHDIRPDLKNMYHPGRISPLRKLMRKFDVVHTHTTPAQLIAACASPGFKGIMVTTEHSSNNKRRNKPYLHWVDRKMYSRYDHIVGCSPDVAAALSSYLGPKFRNITTIINGINISKFADATPAAEIKDTHPGVNIIMVGRFMRPKDQPTVIRALTEVPEAHLWFAGDGKTIGDCKMLAENLGVADRCHFLGNRPDVPALLKAADIAVHSSYWEGLPLSIVEAMAASCAVVASNANGIRDLVNGAGILFECAHHKQLAEILNHLISNHNLYSKTVTACQIRANEYDIRKMTQNYEKLYLVQD